MENDSLFSFSHKVCPKCGIEKLTDEFHIYYSADREKYRIGNYCKPCARSDSKVRAARYFEDNKEERLRYAVEYRADPANREKLSKLSRRFKVQYREALQDCYVRDVLNQRSGIPTSVSRLIPEIVEARRLQIKIRRKLKQLKNGTK